MLSPDAFDKKSKEFKRKANVAQKDAQSKHAASLITHSLPRLPSMISRKRCLTS